MIKIYLRFPEEHFEIIIAFKRFLKNAQIKLRLYEKCADKIKPLKNAQIKMRLYVTFKIEGHITY